MVGKRDLLLDRLSADDALAVFEPRLDAGRFLVDDPFFHLMLFAPEAAVARAATASDTASTAARAATASDTASAARLRKAELKRKA